MKHIMRLWPESFTAVKEEGKTIEMRLYDEKRAAIKTGDTIEFINTDSKERLICEVIGLYRYDSFEKLYSHHDKQAIGYKEGESSDPKDMLAYYSVENVNRYGVLAIEIKPCQPIKK